MPLGSFEEDFFWIAVEDDRLAAPGTNIPLYVFDLFRVACIESNNDLHDQQIQQTELHSGPGSRNSLSKRRRLVPPLLHKTMTDADARQRIEGCEETKVSDAASVAPAPDLELLAGEQYERLARQVIARKKPPPLESQLEFVATVGDTETSTLHSPTQTAEDRNIELLVQESVPCRHPVLPSCNGWFHTKQPVVQIPFKLPVQSHRRFSSSIATAMQSQSVGARVKIFCKNPNPKGGVN